MVGLVALGPYGHRVGLGLRLPAAALGLCRQNVEDLLQTLSQCLLGGLVGIARHGYGRSPEDQATGEGPGQAELPGDEAQLRGGPERHEAAGPRRLRVEGRAQEDLRADPGRGRPGAAGR